LSDEDVLAANEAFYRAFNQKDPEAMDGLWARVAPVRCIHPGWNVLTGRDPVMESWRGILANQAQPKIVMGGASVTSFGDVAVVTCRELVAGTPLAATNIFAVEDGAWRLIHHHSGPVSYTPDD
jgi:ketosteroid isomerase-like protein